MGEVDRALSGHGSCNRRPRSVCRVSFVPFERGIPPARQRDILMGFRRVDRVVGNKVWHVIPAAR